MKDRHQVRLIRKMPGRKTMLYSEVFPIAFHFPCGSKIVVRRDCLSTGFPLGGLRRRSIVDGKIKNLFKRTK